MDSSNKEKKKKGLSVSEHHYCSNITLSLHDPNSEWQSLPVHVCEDKGTTHRTARGGQASGIHPAVSTEHSGGASAKRQVDLVAEAMRTTPQQSHKTGIREESS